MAEDGIAINFKLATDAIKVMKANQPRSVSYRVNLELELVLPCDTDMTSLGCSRTGRKALAGTAASPSKPASF